MFRVTPDTDEMSVHDLIKWQEYFGVTMPNDLSVLLLAIGTGIIWDDGDSREYHLLGPKDSIEYYTSYGFPDCLPDAIPLCMDGGGNFCVYKRIDDRLEAIYVVPAGALFWDEAARIGKNLSELLNSARAPDAFL